MLWSDRCPSLLTARAVFAAPNRTDAAHDAHPGRHNDKKHHPIENDTVHEARHQTEAQGPPSNKDAWAE